MRKTLLLVLLALMPAAPALAQSGRKAATPKPTPTVSPSAPAQTQSKDTAKSSLPEVVDGERIYLSKEVDQKVRILRKPEPGYTREARRNSTRGLVTLRVALASDGTVKHIKILVGLPDGLSEKAIEAAERIRFTPAMKDGKPVSVWVEVIYHFKIY